MNANHELQKQSKHLTKKLKLNLTTELPDLEVCSTNHPIVRALEKARSKSGLTKLEFEYGYDTTCRVSIQTINLVEMKYRITNKLSKIHKIKHKVGDKIFM